MTTKADSGNRVNHTLWRGIDFSGLTVVLGVGTGRLIELLVEQVAASDGNLVAVSHRIENLRSLAPQRGKGSLTLVQGRPRQIPVLSETVDLLVVNGVLREAPENKLDIMLEELWRVIVPGGQLRISDVLEPSEAEYNRAWAERNRLVRKLGKALDRRTALSVNVRRAAMLARSIGFENLKVSILPGFALTDAWLEESVNAARTMASRIVDHKKRDDILDHDLKRLIAAYERGQQRAAERFTMRGTKPGDLALAMEASFTEDDLVLSD